MGVNSSILGNTTTTEERNIAAIFDEYIKEYSAWKSDPSNAQEVQVETNTVLQAYETICNMEINQQADYATSPVKKMCMETSETFNVFASMVIRRMRENKSGIRVFKPYMIANIALVITTMSDGPEKTKALADFQIYLK